MKCPKCNRADLSERGSCAQCGYHEAKAPTPGSDPRCAWTSNGLRCAFPGALSSGTHGEGPWYCRHHFDIRDPGMGAAIDEESQSYRPPRDLREAHERSLELAQRNADAFCAARGLRTAADCIAYCRETLKLPRATDRETIIARWRSIAADQHANQHARLLAQDALTKLAAFAPQRTPGEDDA